MILPMFPSDPAVQVALVGIITTIITTIGVVVVALIASWHRGKGEGPDAALRDRIDILSDRIADLQYDQASLRDRLEDVTAQSEAKSIIIRRLRNGLSEPEEGMSDDDGGDP